MTNAAWFLGGVAVTTVAWLLLVMFWKVPPRQENPLDRELVSYWRAALAHMACQDKALETIADGITVWQSRYTRRAHKRGKEVPESNVAADPNK